MRLLFLFITLLLLTSCYEDRIACLDPDASNYDLQADEACPDDCCTYPNFTVELTRSFGERAFSLDSTYTDGAGNRFKIQRLRFYLGDVGLLANDRPLPVPENIIEVREAIAGDTLLAESNDSNLLVTTTGGNRVVGAYRSGGERSLTALSANLGLVPRIGAVVPRFAPAASPLSTQAGLLNFNDGRGYVQASLEYVLLGSNDTVRVDTYGSEPFVLPFPAAVEPQRGSALTVTVHVDYGLALGMANLAVNPAAFVDNLVAALRVTSVR